MRTPRATGAVHQGDSSSRWWREVTQLCRALSSASSKATLDFYPEWSPRPPQTHNECRALNCSSSARWAGGGWPAETSEGLGVHRTEWCNGTFPEGLEDPHKPLEQKQPDTNMSMLPASYVETMGGVTVEVGPETPEAKARGLQVRGQPRQQSQTRSQMSYFF